MPRTLWGGADAQDMTDEAADQAVAIGDMRTRSNVERAATARATHHDGLGRLRLRVCVRQAHRALSVSARPDLA